MYHQVRHSAILRSAHTVYLCVLCGSETKQRLFPYATLTDWFLLHRFSSLKPSGYYMYHQVRHSAILRFAHTVYLCVLCGSETKQRLFPYATLTDWFLLHRFSSLKPSGYYMYHQVRHSAILRSAHTVCLCVLCGSENK